MCDHACSIVGVRMGMCDCVSVHMGVSRVGMCVCVWESGR